jgi:hypothetical protein
MTAVPVYHAYALPYAALKEAFKHCDSARQILLFNDLAAPGTALAMPVTAALRSDPLKIVALGNPAPCILYKPDILELIASSMKMQIGYTAEFAGRKSYLLVAPEHGLVRAFAVREDKSPLHRAGILAALAEHDGRTHFPALTKGQGLLTAPQAVQPVYGRIPRPQASQPAVKPAVSKAQFNQLPG